MFAVAENSSKNAQISKTTGSYTQRGRVFTAPESPDWRSWCQSRKILVLLHLAKTFLIYPWGACGH